MNMNMKKKYFTALACSLVFIVLTHSFFFLVSRNDIKKDSIKIGIIYVGDGCNAYTRNFMRAEEAIGLKYGTSVEIISKYNVSEGEESIFIEELVNADCDLIFGTSYGYSENFKKYAEANPDIEFCMATGDNANTDKVLSNYHNFMGEIHQGRYISGVVAGLKLKEMIEQNLISVSQAKIGYVASFPYSEVISGFTAFYLGIASVVPEATMSVIYSESWGDYAKEKAITKKLIEENCVIISQHSDTEGPAVACEEASATNNVYHIGYNQTMSDVAPRTSLISSRIDWEVYMLSAVDAVFSGKKIESCIKGNIYGNDASGGFKEGWVRMLKLNDTIAAKGTEEVINKLINDFKKDKITVFKGNYIGVDPFNESDTYDLSKGYKENEKRSSPSFHYILKDVITIEDFIEE